MFKWLIILAFVAPLTACLEDKEAKEEAPEVMIETTAQDDAPDGEPQEAEQAEEADEAPPAEEEPASE